METAIDFELIKKQITAIHDAEKAGSVTNVMVADILEAFRNSLASVNTGVESAFPSTSGEKLNKQITNIGILPFDGVIDDESQTPSSGVWLDSKQGFLSFGNTGYYGFSSEHYNGVGSRNSRLYRKGKELYYFDEKNQLKRFCTLEELETAVKGMEKKIYFRGMSEEGRWRLQLEEGQAKEILERTGTSAGVPKYTGLVLTVDREAMNCTGVQRENGVNYIYAFFERRAVINQANTTLGYFKATISENEGEQKLEWIPEGDGTGVEKLGFYTKEGSGLGLEFEIEPDSNQTANVAFEAPLTVGKTEDQFKMATIGLDTEKVNLELIAKQWEQYCTVRGIKYGKFNPVTKMGELNGLTDITVDEMIEIMQVPKQAVGAIQRETPYGYTGLARTFAPVFVYDSGYCYDLFAFCSNLEAVRIVNYYMWNETYIDNTATTLKMTRQMFANVPKLKHVYGILKMATGDAMNVHFYNCQVPALESIKLQGICLDVQLFTQASKIGFESLRYMVDNAANTGVITVTVHADVYKALCGEAASYPFNGGSQQQWTQLLTDAVAKQISFATA